MAAGDGGRAWVIRKSFFRFEEVYAKAPDARSDSRHTRTRAQTNRTRGMAAAVHGAGPVQTGCEPWGWRKGRRRPGRSPRRSLWN
jgi:hypothetical protein